MFVLIFLAVVIGALLWLAHLVDRRNRSRGAGSEGLDTARTRIEGGMILGRDWRPGGPGRAR